MGGERLAMTSGVEKIELTPFYKKTLTISLMKI